MQQDLQWRSEPLYQEDFTKRRIQRTDPYGRHLSSVSSEANRDTQVYRKKFHTLVAENQVLSRENEILRNFLLLKKENCDLKTLDIITNALAMCDEKLNEFILNLHNFPERRSPLPSPAVDTRPKHIVNTKTDKYRSILANAEPQSPSYGASFPEVHYSELEAYDDNQISMYKSDNRRYPGSYENEYPDSIHCTGKYMYDDSSSYGQSFPQLDYNELLEETAPQRKDEYTAEYEVTYRNKYPNKPPVIASVPTRRTIFSPTQRNAPNTGSPQGTMSNKRTINQPPKQFFSETPRHRLRTMTPTRPQNETRDHFDSQQKDISSTQFDPHSSKFSSFKHSRYSSTPARTAFYDSLEASEMANRKFTTHSSSHGRPATNLSSYQTQAGGFHKASMNDFTPPNMNSRCSDERNHDEMYQGKLHRPATGNVDSFCQCSSPVYTSSGQQREMNFIASKMLNKTNRGNSQTSAGQTLKNVSPTASEAPSYIRQQRVVYDSKNPPRPSPVDRSDYEIVHGNRSVITKSPKSSLKKRVIVLDNQNMAEQSQMKQDQSVIGTQDEQFRILNSHSKTAADDYKRTDTNRSIENNQENNEKSVWINITQRARILTEGHDDAQDQYTSVDSNDYSTAVEHQQQEDTGYPTVADFQVTEPPLYTSTPKHSYTKKEARDLPAQEIDQSTKPRDNTYEQLVTNEALKTTDVSPRGVALDVRADYAKTSNVGPISPTIAPGIDSTGNRQEFDESLAEAVIQTHPKLGRSEIVKSVLYRPVDILTGYSPNVTLLTTNMALRSKPNRRLVGEIAFQLDRRIMELVTGPKRSSSDRKLKRSRYYGYSIVNIYQLIKKEASLKSQSNPDNIHKVEEEMKQRLEHVLATLKPFGYNLDVHAYFTQDMVNKYGLMKEAPHIDTVEGFGLHEPVILRMLLGRILGHGPILDNMLILLDCLCILSHFDKSPLFVW